jgi:hypothetical protein
MYKYRILYLCVPYCIIVRNTSRQKICIDCRSFFSSLKDIAQLMEHHCLASVKQYAFLQIEDQIKQPQNEK